MYQNYIFDLYGTLVDINTNEWKMYLWEKLRIFYGYYGAHYTARELKNSYEQLVSFKEKEMVDKGVDMGPHYSHESYPEIEIDAWNGWVKVNGADVKMSRPCFAALLLLASGCEPKKLHARLCELHAQHGAAECDWLSTFRTGTLFTNPDFVEDLTKTLSNLRKSLSAAGFQNVETLVPQRFRPVTFLISNIKWSNKKRILICNEESFK